MKWEPEKLVLAPCGGTGALEGGGRAAGLEEMFICTGVILDRMPQNSFFVSVRREHGADRIVFGTDSPWARSEKVCRDFEGNAFRRGRTKSDFAGTAQVKLLGL